LAVFGMMEHDRRCQLNIFNPLVETPGDDVSDDPRSLETLQRL